MRKIINKKSIGVLLVIAIASMSMTVFASPVNTPIYINGLNKATGFIEKGKTYIPLRDVSEALGASVGWENSTKTVTISKPGTIITQRIGQSSATVNGRRVDAGAPAQIRFSRTYVPLRFVSENLGATVHWNANKRVVEITAAGQPSAPPTGGPKTVDEYKELIKQAKFIGDFDMKPLSSYTTADKIPDTMRGKMFGGGIAFVDKSVLPVNLDGMGHILFDIDTGIYNGHPVLELTTLTRNTNTGTPVVFPSKKTGMMVVRHYKAVDKSEVLQNLGDGRYVVKERYYLPVKDVDGINPHEIDGFGTSYGPDMNLNNQKTLVIKY